MTRRWKNGARARSNCGALCGRIFAGGAGILDPAAIATVAAESWPDVRDADELHDALLTLITLPPVEEWQAFFSELADNGRARRASNAVGKRFWVATERLHCSRWTCSRPCGAGWSRSAR